MTDTKPTEISQWQNDNFRAISTKGNLKCIYTSCFYYFWKTGSPSYKLSVVKNFQICNPPDFEFYLGKTNFTIWCNVNFESVFTAINKKEVKTEPKLTLHHMGKMFIS